MGNQKVKKERLDVMLVEQGFFDSRENAKRHIMAGIILVNDVPVDKAGTKIPVDAKLRIKGYVMPYVGRGGYKLEKAIKTFGIDMKGKVMADIGASTGGFTDCMLQNGATKVYAVDVGYGLCYRCRDQSARLEAPLSSAGRQYGKDKYQSRDRRDAGGEGRPRFDGCIFHIRPENYSGGEIHPEGRWRDGDTDQAAV